MRIAGCLLLAAGCATATPRTYQECRRYEQRADGLGMATITLAGVATVAAGTAAAATLLEINKEKEGATPETVENEMAVGFSITAALVAAGAVTTAIVGRVHRTRMKAQRCAVTLDAGPPPASEAAPPDAAAPDETAADPEPKPKPNNERRNNDDGKRKDTGTKKEDPAPASGGKPPPPPPPPPPKSNKGLALTGLRDPVTASFVARPALPTRPFVP